MKSMAHALQYLVIRTLPEEEIPKTHTFSLTITNPSLFFFFFLSQEKIKLLSESAVADLKVSKPFQERVIDVMLVLVMVG